MRTKKCGMARDILTDENGDLKIVGGDFATGQSDEQHLVDILSANKGEYKQHPLVGVGIQDWLNGPITSLELARLEKEIRTQLEADGASDISVSFGDTLKVEARYE